MLEKSRRIWHNVGSFLFCNLANQKFFDKYAQSNHNQMEIVERLEQNIGNVVEIKLKYRFSN
jgi:hypothetical protein